MTRIDHDALLAAACEATGLDDFGTNDFEAGLSVLLRSYDQDARLTPLGEKLVWDELIGDLSGRLQVVDYLKREPEIARAELERPIFILGLPRTGTTTLQQIFQQDPESQVLEYWLGVTPQPRPPRETWEENTGYRRVAEVLRLTYEADPGLRALHDVSAESGGECRFVFRHLFMDDSYDHTAYLPSYREWFDAQPMDRVYRWYRDVLKVIQHPNTGRRWILKYPPHIRCLREIFAEFPDACIIQTHRDPARVLPSQASLLTHFSKVYEENVDAARIGRFIVDLWDERLHAGIRAREELDRESQFFDLHFREVLSDPVGSIRRALDSFGMELSEEAAARMKAWHTNHPPGRHGKHDYSPESYGIDRQDLSSRFHDYRERFGVDAETLG
ncbi:MAG: sulfotransferase [Deltaproteobacteria bacterium]|jgi:hypothetical protein|nr:sulfotransferase [Deltaproteobacteria bacterium]MBW2499585.1 sulfotransferase [Deltaproteobacteria bacterium]